MADKKKAAQVASTGTAQKTKYRTGNVTGIDPLLGWHELAKPSRERQQKRSWKRGRK